MALSSEAISVLSFSGSFGLKGRAGTGLLGLGEKWGAEKASWGGSESHGPA